MADWARKRFDVRGSAPRLGVKDIIDVAGEVNTAGSLIVASRVRPATRTADVVQSALDRGASISALTVLVELAYGAQGINPHFGTPANPRTPDLICGGSSSGSAVGVAAGELDVGYGTDTGGSVRIPAACCGVFGLKTTHGRVSTNGVYPLSQSLDTVGPLARGLDELEMGFDWLVDGDHPVDTSPYSRIIVAPTAESPLIDASITHFARGGGRLNVEVDLREELTRAWEHGSVVMGREAWENDEWLTDEIERMDPKVSERLLAGGRRTDEALEAARHFAIEWRTQLDALLGDDGVLCLATIPFAIPTIPHAYDRWLNVNTLPFNLAGYPSLAVPIPLEFSERVRREQGIDGQDLGQGRGANGTAVPVSMQLVGIPGSEERLMATARKMFSAARS
jgi:Asp-tRNA(Asn)/Glu-tRNA(Gln) amidotransferase A subunit family amidase